MVRAIIQDRLHAHYRISGQRSFKYRFLESLLYSRKIILRNRSAYHHFFKHERRLQISRRLKLHLNMAVLSVSAGLLLVLGIHIRILLQSLAECNLRRLQYNLALISCSQLACNNLKVLVAHTVKQRLAVLAVIDYLNRNVFRHHPLQRLRHLVLIPLILAGILHICIRLGVFCLSKQNLISFGRQSIAGLRAGQLCNRANIAGKHLAYFHRLITAHGINLTKLLLCLRTCVI